MTTVTPRMLPIDSMWRLTTDVPLRGAVVSNYYNDELEKNLGIDLSVDAWGERPTSAPYGWWDEDPMRRDRYAKWQQDTLLAADIKFPAGTIIRIERYHVSRSGEDQITIMLMVSPDPRLCPKKMGGRMKGKGRVYLWLEDFNNLGPVEYVEALN